MSTIEIPTYVPAIPLPAPVTSGSGIQSYTDPYGDVWVAANGVNGGAWRRARDVLYGRVGRTAAYNYVQNTPTAIPWTTPAQHDTYGMYTVAQNGFTVPVAGLWTVHAQLCITFTAVGQFLGLYVGPNHRSNTQAGTTGNTYCHGHDVVPCNAGDVLTTLGYSGTAGLAMAGLTSSDVYFTVKYEGTG